MKADVDAKGLEYWTRQASQHWSSPRGLVFASIANAIIAFWLASVLSPLLSLIAFAAIECGLIFWWALSRRIPRCPRGKIGFVAVFECEDAVVRKQFQSDFTTNLRLLLSEGTSAESFWFRDFTGRPGISVLTESDARQLQATTRSYFVLYGRVRSRGKTNDVKHTVDISGLVWHGQIHEHNQRLLAREFSELLPRRVQIRDDMSLPAFELSATLAEIAARYVIAIALECTGSLDHAETLFDELEPRTRSAALIGIPIIAKIAARIPTRRMEIAVSRAKAIYNKWRVTHESELLAQMDQFLETVDLSQRHHANWNALKAITAVALHNDLKGAEAHVKACGRDAPISRMNLAFIAACRRDLRAAVKHYRAAKSGGIELATVEETMDFIDWYRAEHPETTAELAFCLGFVACEIEGDKTLAAGYFDEFKEICPKGNHKEQLDLIPKWMNQPKH